LQDPGVTGVLGVDGCRGGWVGALVEGRRVSWHRFATIAEALAVPVPAIGVDMPIGLPATGRRSCDLEAKALLGRAHPRVFLAPPRGVLAAATYEEAGRLHRELTGGLGLSVQTWHLVPKIREVDAVAGDPRLVEVHPELSLAALGGAGPLPSKKTAAGRAARVSVLTGWLGDLADLPAGDDGLDALAVAWSAHRWLAGRARSLPGVPAYDETGRPMRIVT
jgi:predicted RNase H-like nuclease